MGDPNASIPTPQPYFSRPMFGALGKAVGGTSKVFVSKTSLKQVAKYGLSKQAVAVENCRNISKKNMHFNSELPNIKVDPERYKVTVDDVHLTCEPVSKVPLAQLYHLF